LDNIVEKIARYIEWISIKNNYGFIGRIFKNRYVVWITMDISKYQLDNIDGYLKKCIEWIFLLNKNG
jgi:hypothetical protein